MSSHFYWSWNGVEFSEKKNRAGSSGNSSALVNEDHAMNWWISNFIVPKSPRSSFMGWSMAKTSARGANREQQARRTRDKIIRIVLNASKANCHRLPFFEYIRRISSQNRCEWLIVCKIELFESHHKWQSLSIFTVAIFLLRFWNVAAWIGGCTRNRKTFYKAA